MTEDTNKAASSSSSSSSSSNENPGEEIQVICAGFGRTGTMSLTEALNQLGYKTYHFIDFNHHSDWAEVSDGKRSVDAIINRIAQDGYTATLENPTSDIYLDILQRYPNAKVVLTERDTPEKFVESWKILMDTMVITEQKFSWTFPSFFGYIPLFANLKKTRFFMGTTHLGLKPGALTHGWRDHSSNATADEWLVEQYLRHNEHVQANVPSDQLLVFNVKQGWEPLCTFLGKPIPEDGKAPFPHVKINDSKALLTLRKYFLAVVYGWIPSVLLSAGAAYVLSQRSESSSLSLSNFSPKSLLPLFPFQKSNEL